MSGDDQDSPHTERMAFCNLVYWKDGVACGKLDGWTRVELEAFGRFPSLTFAPNEAPAILATLRLLEKAYEQGRRDKAAEVRDVLGIPGPPSERWTP